SAARRATLPPHRRRHARHRRGRRCDFRSDAGRQRAPVAGAGVAAAGTRYRTMTVRAVVSLLLLLAGAMAGCATTPFGPAALDAGDRPRRSTSRERDMAAEAYYHYTVAQMAAQAGRFKDALPPM